MRERAWRRMPTIYLPHGGGPCFFMRPGEVFAAGLWDDMAAYLSGLAATLPERPKSLLVISAHWETPQPTLYAPPQTKLLYDYYNFPEYTYRIPYSAPADAALAGRVKALLAAAGIPCDDDSERGFDHGVFIPLKLVFPDADIPIVQLSLQEDFDPALHLAMGRALAPLRDEGVLIVGSGMSFHNMRAGRFSSPEADAASERFDSWLNAAVNEADPALRARLLEQWETAPDAIFCHPRPEHLFPLFVVAGAGEADRPKTAYRGLMFGKRFSGFQFG